MRYLRQFCIILVIAFAGDMLHSILPFPVPGSIYGIVIMLVLLCSRIMPLSAVKETGKFLVEIMPVMFVPAAVGLIESWDIIRGSILPYAMVTLVSTVLVMAVSGLVTQAAVKSGNMKRDNVQSDNVQSDKRN